MESKSNRMITKEKLQKYMKDEDYKDPLFDVWRCLLRNSKSYSSGLIDYLKTHYEYKYKGVLEGEDKSDTAKRRLKGEGFNDAMYLVKEYLRALDLELVEKQKSKCID